MQWRLELLLQSAIERFFARLPGAWVFRMGDMLGRLLWHVLPARRRIVLKNLRIVCAEEKTPEEIHTLARATFRRIGANLLSVLRTARIPAEELLASVTIENPELLAEAVSDGRGVVLLPPHMGNWEILSRINQLYPPGHACGALYRPLNNPILDTRVKQQRESEGTRLFSKRDSISHITTFLRGGGILGILADQRAGPQGKHARFFGRLTRSSPLPALLAKRCGCLALSISIRAIAPGKWNLRFHPVANPHDTESCATAIEAAMRHSLEDVFWLHDRWRTYITDGNDIRRWLGEGTSAPQKQHRALLWLDGVSEDWKIPDSWSHPDVRYECLLAPGQLLPSSLANHIVHRSTTRPSDWRGVRRMLQSIDASAPLPLDFVVAPGLTPPGFSRACKREAIAFACIPHQHV